MWKRDGGCLRGYLENGSQATTTLGQPRTETKIVKDK